MNSDFWKCPDCGKRVDSIKHDPNCKPRPLSQGAKMVKGLIVKGGKLARVDTDEFRVDMPDGSYSFVPEKFIVELVERGRLLPEVLSQK